MYKLTISGQSIIRMSDGAFIPTDPKSSSYAAYQRWLAEGNTPEPAETSAETLSRLQSQWRSERDRLMREADLWELPSFQARYGVTQQQVVDFKAKLYDVPGTIEGIENFVWPARLK